MYVPGMLETGNDLGRGRRASAAAGSAVYRSAIVGRDGP